MIELDAPPNRISTISTQLQRATGFVGIAKVLLTTGAQLFGLHQMQTSLVSASGRPMLMVDNVPNLTDELRLLYLREMWVVDHLLRAVREHHAPAGEEVMSARGLMRILRDHGYKGDYVHSLALPILEPAGLIGVIICGHKQPFTVELRRELTAVSTHVSIRMLQLGITTLREESTLEKLTLRQFEVAQLAASGRSNHDIAQVLTLSENTVKKHLKEVFARVGASNRTELAGLLGQARRPDDVPVGITRDGALTITKGAA